jgi:hypothetical protein
MLIYIQKGVQVFLTTDDAILFNADHISKYNIAVKNPTEMV